MKKGIERPVAALIMFTKLPLWKLFPNIPGEAYRHVVTWWPLCGWITGAICGGLYWIFSFVLPPIPSAFLAIGGRLLFTGGYHEDGLADFFDGFGGGSSKEKILSIMKDSHIGTYGVISLIMFLGTLISLISSLPPQTGILMMICADPWSKFCSGRMLSFLKYAREDGKSKNMATYPQPSIKDTCMSLFFGIMPMLFSCHYQPHTMLPIFCGVGASVIMTSILFMIMKKRIGGYTGDCCGAVCLISEISFCLFFSIFYL